MPERSHIGHLAKRDLRHPLGSQPVRPTNLCARRLHRRRLLFERCHDHHQADDLLVVETGADLAGVTEHSILGDAQDQRSEKPRLVRRRPSDHDEFLTLDTFGREPASRSRADVPAIGRLGDDSLEARGAELV